MGARPRIRRLAVVAGRTRAILVGRRPELVVLTGAVRAAVAAKAPAVRRHRWCSRGGGSGPSPRPGAGIVHGAKGSKGSDAPRTECPAT